MATTADPEVMRAFGDPNLSLPQGHDDARQRLANCH